MLRKHKCLRKKISQRIDEGEDVKREDEEAEAEAFKGEEGDMEGEEMGVSPPSDLQAKVFAVGEVVEARWWKLGQARWWKVLIYVHILYMYKRDKQKEV